jgi:hypothetical protein
VEHPCPCCNSPVEEGSPFCPGCGAAQIRFAGREHSRQPLSVASAFSAPPAHLESPELQASTLPRDPRSALRAALYAGIIAAFLSSIPLGANFILALPLAGCLSVLFYRRWVPGPEPQTWAAFRLGAMAGLIGFLAFLALTAIGTFTFHAQEQLRDTMLQAVRQAQERTPDPEARQMLNYFTSPQGVALMMVLGLAFMGIVFVLLSGVGAVVTAALLRRKTPPEQ